MIGSKAYFSNVYTNYKDDVILGIFFCSPLWSLSSFSCSKKLFVTEIVMLSYEYCSVINWFNLPCCMFPIAPFVIETCYTLYLESLPDLEPRPDLFVLDNNPTMCSKT